MSSVTNSEFTNMKIRVKDEEHSKQVQEVLFRLGYKWSSGYTEPKYLDKKFIIAYEDGEINYHISESFFDEIRLWK